MILSDNSQEIVNPEKRDYGSNWSPTTEMGLKSNWKRDITVSISEIIDDSRVVYRLTVQPFLKLLWVGGIISVIGFLIVLKGKR